jgi:hypothetical protein
MVRRTVLALAALMVASCSAGHAPPPKPPRYEPVGATVLLSANGRVITAIGTVVCGRAQRLVARFYPGKVALILENPDHNCNDLGSVPAPYQFVPAITRLPAPLGNRALMRVGQKRGTLPYFSERDLASVRRLPFRLRLSSDEPANVTGRQGQAEIGDTRAYTSPKAALELTQIVSSPSLPARTYWFNTSCPEVIGWHPRHGLGNCRGVTWVAHGYHFLVGMAVERGMTLSVHELRTIAEGILVSPGQYR